MKVDPILAALAVIGAFLVGALLGVGQGTIDATRRMRQQAIEHGAALYVCDPRTGEAMFKWKDHK